MMATLEINTRRPIQVRAAIHRSDRLAADQPWSRARLRLMSVAATGKLGIPRSAPKPWRLPWVVSSLRLAVIGSLVKMAATVMPLALIRSRAKPIRPPVVRICGLMAAISATQLDARERKATTITQP
jgi:hypothetical protein